jgi:hypothetical protein
MRALSKEVSIGQFIFYALGTRLLRADDAIQ